MDKPSPWAPYRATSATANRRRPTAKRVTLCVAVLTIGIIAFAVRRKSRAPAVVHGIPSVLLHRSEQLVLAPEELLPAVPLQPLLDEPAALALVDPPEGATRLPLGQSLVFRFNRPMVRGSAVHQETASPPIELSPPMAGRWQWSSRSTISFAPAASAWSSARECSVAVRSGTTSLSGEALSDDTPRTVVFDNSPHLAPNAIRQRASGRSFRLAFNGHVEPSSLQHQILVYERGGGGRSLGFSLRSSGRDEQSHSLVDLTLARTLEPGARVDVAFEPSLYASDYNESPGVMTFAIEPRPRVEGVDCQSNATSPSHCRYGDHPGQIVDITDALRIFTTRPVDASAAQRFVNVTPALPNRELSTAGNVLTLRGDWNPDQVYSVSLGSLTDTTGQHLLPAPSLAVRSQGLTPAVIARSGPIVYEIDASTVLPFAGVNLARASVFALSIVRGEELNVDRNTGVLSLSPVGWSHRALGTWAPTARANRWGRGELNWLTDLGAGPVALVAIDPDTTDNTTAHATLFQQTDLGLSTQLLPSGVLVWITSINTAEPVLNATVTLTHLDTPNPSDTQRTTHTDSNGLAWIEGIFDSNHGRYLVTATTSSHRAVSIIDTRSAARPASFGLDETGTSTNETATAFIFTDRGAYRPGDTVHTRVLVRHVNHGVITLSRRSQWRLVLRSLDGPVTEQRLRADRWGGLDAQFALPADAIPGQYTLALHRLHGEEPIATHNFTLAAFRPPTLRLELSQIRNPAIDRGAIETTASAQLLSGPPLSNSTLRWTLTRTGAAPAPAQWSDWRFGPFDSIAAQGTESEGSVITSTTGSATISARIINATPSRESALLEVVAQDPSGQQTRATQTLTAFSADHEIALRNGPEWLEPGTPLNADVIALDHSGTPVTNKPITVTIFREGWHSYWQWSGSADTGNWAPRREHLRQVAHRCTLTSVLTPVRCSWSPDRPGTYVIEASSVDSSHRRSIASRRLYLSAPGEHPDRDPPGAPMALTPLRPRWHVGETARLTFECPWPRADALITVVRNQVLHRERRSVTSGGATINIPVTREMLPNASVIVTLVRPRTGPHTALGTPDPNAPDLRWGAAELSVDAPTEALSLHVQVPSGAQRPETDVPIEVHVTDPNGRPAHAVVTLWAVDEGTLRLTHYTTPDFTQSLRPRTAPLFALEDLRRSLASRIAFPALPAASGDGPSDSSTDNSLLEVRDGFEPTALWLPHITTDSSGIARTTLRLPTRAGELRVMAIATDTSSRSGRAWTSLSSTRPVVGQPLFPRVVTDGDRFSPAVISRNTTDRPLHATVRFSLGNTMVSTHSIDLPPHSDSLTSVSLIASATTTHLSVDIESEGTHDRHSQSLFVRSRTRALRTALIGATRSTQRINFSVPLWASNTSLSLTVAPHPFIGLDSALASLASSFDNSPEALASRALAYVSLRTLNLAAPNPQQQQSQLQDNSERSLAALAALQTPSGGFGAYDSRDYPDAFVTAWVLHAMATVRHQGWRVDTDRLDRAAQWLTGYVSQGPQGAAWDTFALALRALRESGRDVTTPIATLYDRRELLSTHGLAMLALAMSPHDPRRTGLITAAVRQSGASSRHPVGWFHGAAHEWGAVLEAVAPIASQNTAANRAAGALLAARNNGTDGGWATTYQTSAALSALAAYARVFTTEAELHTHVTLSLDGNELTGRTLRDTRRWQLGSSRLPHGEHQLSLTSTGPIFYSLEATWNAPLGPTDTIARGRGAALHRIIERESGQPLGDGDTVHVGELLRVRLFVYSERSLPPFCAVRDPIAGGVDPLDRGLDTTPRASLDALVGAGPDDDAIDARVAYASRSLNTIARRVFSPASATFELNPDTEGLQEYTYAVRASVPGDFTIPPAVLSARYDTDVVARSAMNTLRVVR